MTAKCSRIFSAFCGLVLSIVSGIDADERPKRLAVEPNAILRLDDPLTITVDGVEPGNSVLLEVFDDCLDTPADCPRIFHRTSAEADEGVVKDVLLYKELVDAGAASPEGRRLWLRVSLPGSDRYRQAMFGYGVSECSLFDVIFDAFTLGECNPRLLQVLRDHRQPSELVDNLFEVRALGLDPGDEPVPVPGTRGAGGVAWLDGETLLVTAAGLGADATLAAGLYRVPVDGSAEPKRLWAPGAGEAPPTAPTALPAGRIAFVVQAHGPQKADDPDPVAWLVVLGGQAEEARIPLSHRMHQILAVDPGGTRLLMLSLGVGDNHPTLVSVDLATETVVPVGFSNALYEAAMRGPDGRLALVAFENTFGGRGWEIVLTCEGHLVRPLVKRNRVNDLAPSWRPSGVGLAYLAQVGMVQ